MDSAGNTSSLSRRNSSDTDEWVIVNAQGTEIDNFSCQTGVGNGNDKLEQIDEPHNIDAELSFVNTSVLVDLMIQNSCNNEESSENILQVPQLEQQKVEENVQVVALETVPVSSPVDLPANDTCLEEKNLNIVPELEVDSITESTSSACPSDISLLNDDATSLENDENELHIEDQPDVALETVDETSGFYLPFIGVSAFKKFYLSCAAFATLGVVLLFMSSRLSRLEKQKVVVMTESVSKMQRCENYVTDLRRELAACKTSSKEFCEREDKPSCYGNNFKMDESAKWKIEQMDAYAKQFDMEHKILVNEISKLQSNLTNYLLSYSGLILTERLEIVRLRRLNALYQARLKNVNFELKKSDETESMLRHLLAQLENRANNLYRELSKSDSERIRYESLYNSCDQRNSNFDELLNLTNSFWNGRILPTFRQFYESVQKNVDEATKSADIDDYLRKFKTNFVDHVGTTVTSFWQKAKDVSKSLSEECKKSSSDFGDAGGSSSYCNILYPFADDENENSDLYSDSDNSDTVEIHQQDNIFDDDDHLSTIEINGDGDVVADHADIGDNSRNVVPEDQQSVNEEEEIDDDPNGGDTEGVLQQPITLDDADDADALPIDDNVIVGLEPNFNDDEILAEKFVKQVKKFRNALKSSTEFHRSIDEDDAEHYVSRLKRLFKTSQMRFVDDASWWFCQKVWWSGSRDADCPASKLLSWQRPCGVDTDACGKILTHHKRRQILRAVKSLADVVDEFGVEQQKRVNGDSRWFFERWRNRREQRDDARRGFDASAWVFTRGKERDASRKNDRSAKKSGRTNTKRRRHFQWGYENYF